MSATPKTPEAPSDAYAYTAIVLAAIGSLGGLYLSAAEGKYPCPLCFYQRAFMFGVLGVMVAGLLTKMNDKVSVATLALPVAMGGLGVALWHTNLERGDAPKLICPAGAFGLFSAPTQSAILFGLLCAVLIIDAYQEGRIGTGVPQVVGSAALGVVIAIALCDPMGMWNANAQPKRVVPPEEYEAPIKICLPPLPKKE